MHPIEENQSFNSNKFGTTRKLKLKKKKNIINQERSNFIKALNDDTTDSEAETVIESPKKRRVKVESSDSDSDSSAKSTSSTSKLKRLTKRKHKSLDYKKIVPKSSTINGNSNINGNPISINNENQITSSKQSKAKSNSRKGRDAAGRSRLQRASVKGNIEEVKRLIESGVDVDDKDYAGLTALHEAALKGYTDVVRVLLACGATVDIQSGPEDLDTPLIDASTNGHINTVKVLLEHGADPRIRNAHGQNALDSVPEDLSDDELDQLLKKKMHSLKDKPLNTINKPSISQYEKSSHSPGPDDQRYYSSSNSKRHGVRGQVSRNDLLWVDATTRAGREKVYKKAADGDLEFVGKFLEGGWVPDVEAVSLAAHHGHTDLVGLLLAFGAPINGTDENGNTPLSTVIGRGHLDVVKLLLSSGANPLIKDNNGKNALDFAYENVSIDDAEYICLKEAAKKFSKSKDSRKEKSVTSYENQSSKSHSRASSNQNESKDYLKNTHFLKENSQNSDKENNEKQRSKAETKPLIKIEEKQLRDKEVKLENNRNSLKNLEETNTSTENFKYKKHIKGERSNQTHNLVKEMDQNVSNKESGQKRNKDSENLRIDRSTSLKVKKHSLIEKQDLHAKDIGHEKHTKNDRIISNNITKSKFKNSIFSSTEKTAPSKSDSISNSNINQDNKTVDNDQKLSKQDTKNASTNGLKRKNSSENGLKTNELQDAVNDIFDLPGNDKRLQKKQKTVEKPDTTTPKLEREAILKKKLETTPKLEREAIFRKKPETTPKLEKETTIKKKLLKLDEIDKSVDNSKQTLNNEFTKPHKIFSEISSTNIKTQPSILKKDSSNRTSVLLPPFKESKKEIIFKDKVQIDTFNENESVAIDFLVDKESQSQVKNPINTSVSSTTTIAQKETEVNSSLMKEKKQVDDIISIKKTSSTTFKEESTNNTSKFDTNKPSMFSWRCSFSSGLPYELRYYDNLEHDPNSYLPIYVFELPDVDIVDGKYTRKEGKFPFWVSDIHLELILNQRINFHEIKDNSIRPLSTSEKQRLWRVMSIYVCKKYAPFDPISIDDILSEKEAERVKFERLEMNWIKFEDALVYAKSKSEDLYLKLKEMQPITVYIEPEENFQGTNILPISLEPQLT